jgi:hypothetical protein
MHDEFERALGVRRRRGISVLGWIGIALGGFVLVGATGVFLAFRAATTQVREVVERVQLRLPPESPDAMSRTVARTVAHTLSEMGTAPTADEDRIAAVVARALSASGQDRSGREGSGAEGGMAPAPLGSTADPPSRSPGDMEGFLRIRTRDGEIRADLRTGEDGGSLVIRAEDGDVLVDLSGDARGGRLYVRGEGEVASFRTGEAAARAPRWVPPVDAGAQEMQRVLSGYAGGGVFGARTWLTASSPDEVVRAFRERLGGEGWEVQAEHRLRDRDEVSASVVGRQEASGRTVVLAAGLEEGRTRVVLGWGEHVPSRR